MADVLYIYFGGSSLEAVADALTGRLTSFVEARDWRFFDVWCGKQRNGEHREIGLNLAVDFGAREENVLRRDEIVFEGLRFVFGALQQRERAT